MGKKSVPLSCYLRIFLRLCCCPKEEKEFSFIPSVPGRNREVEWQQYWKLLSIRSDLVQSMVLPAHRQQYTELCGKSEMNCIFLRCYSSLHSQKASASLNSGFPFLLCPVMMSWSTNCPPNKLPSNSSTVAFFFFPLWLPRTFTLCLVTWNTYALHIGNKVSWGNTLSGCSVFC